MPAASRQAAPALKRRSSPSGADSRRAHDAALGAARQPIYPKTFASPPRLLEPRSPASNTRPFFASYALQLPGSSLHGHRLRPSPLFAFKLAPLLAHSSPDGAALPVHSTSSAPPQQTHKLSLLIFLTTPFALCSVFLFPFQQTSRLICPKLGTNALQAPPAGLATGSTTTTTHIHALPFSARSLFSTRAAPFRLAAQRSLLCLARRPRLPRARARARAFALSLLSSLCRAHKSLSAHLRHKNELPWSSHSVSACVLRSRQGVRQCAFPGASAAAPIE